MPDVPVTGRRRVVETRRRLPSVLTVLAAVIPLLTVGALAVVRPAAVPDLTRAPDRAPLVRSTLSCPPGVPGAGRVRLAGASAAWEGRSGDLLTVPQERHSLEALEDAAVLLTVVGR